MKCKESISIHKIETFYTKIERWINRLTTFVWIIDFHPFRDNRFEDKRQSLNGFIVERKVDKSKSVFLIPEYWKSKKKAIDSTIFMIPRKTMILLNTMNDYSKKDWNWKIIIQRSKYHWKTMTNFEWKVENWMIHQTNLRKSTHRAHIHETLKNSRIPVYTRIRMRYFFKFLSLIQSINNWFGVSLGTIVPSQAAPNHTLCAGTCLAHVFKFPV